MLIKKKSCHNNKSLSIILLLHMQVGIIPVYPGKAGKSLLHGFFVFFFLFHNGQIPSYSRTMSIPCLSSSHIPSRLPSASREHWVNAFLFTEAGFPDYKLSVFKCLKIRCTDFRPLRSAQPPLPHWEIRSGPVRSQLVVAFLSYVRLNRMPLPLQC